MNGNYGVTMEWIFYCHKATNPVVTPRLTQFVAKYTKHGAFGKRDPGFLKG